MMTCSILALNALLLLCHLVSYAFQQGNHQVLKELYDMCMIEVIISQFSLTHVRPLLQWITSSSVFRMTEWGYFSVISLVVTPTIESSCFGVVWSAVDCLG